jgi:hypothetical protein
MADRPVGLSDDEKSDRRRRRAKNIAVGVALFALAVLFYLVTMVKIGSTLP